MADEKNITQFAVDVFVIDRKFPPFIKCWDCDEITTEIGDVSKCPNCESLSFSLYVPIDLNRHLVGDKNEK